MENLGERLEKDKGRGAVFRLMSVGTFDARWWIYANR